MSSYLLFRTDRIGDFLLSAVLINSIKRNDPNSIITVVSSIKNYEYIKSFDCVDEVIMLKNNFLGKVKLIRKLRSNYYDYVITHDQKKRSFIISFFLKYGYKIKVNKNSNISYIDGIQKILSKLNFNLSNLDLNTLSHRDYNSTKLYNNNFVLLHFDEKWIYESYISEYTNIEPSKNELLRFINLLLLKSNKEIIITTGISCPLVLTDILKENFNHKIKIYEKLNFFALEEVVSKSSLLISCHGSISHVAAAHNIRQIDIIEKNKASFYLRWTKHFRNYEPLFRKKFHVLSMEIINLL